MLPSHDGSCKSFRRLPPGARFPGPCLSVAFRLESGCGGYASEVAEERSSRYGLGSFCWLRETKGALLSGQWQVVSFGRRCVDAFSKVYI